MSKGNKLLLLFILFTGFFYYFNFFSRKTAAPVSAQIACRQQNQTCSTNPGSPYHCCTGLDCKNFRCVAATPTPTGPLPTPTYLPSIPPLTPPPNCPKKAQGDANCDGTVNDVDYMLWRIEFLTQPPPPTTTPSVTITQGPTPPPTTPTPTGAGCRQLLQRCNNRNPCCSGLSCASGFCIPPPRR